MKKVTYPILIAFLLILSAQRGNAQTESPSFDFKTKKVENNIIEARFRLTNAVDIERLKPKILALHKVVAFNELKKDKSYYQIRYYNVTDLNALRAVLKSFQTDFDLTYIVVKNKSYFNQ